MAVKQINVTPIANNILCMTDRLKHNRSCLNLKLHPAAVLIALSPSFNCTAQQYFGCVVATKTSCEASLILCQRKWRSGTRLKQGCKKSKMPRLDEECDT